AEVCGSSQNACPADRKQPVGTVCRASAGVCDVVETCDGVSNSCPADAFQPGTTECRAAAGACDVAELCTGTSATCPADAKSTAPPGDRRGLAGRREELGGLSPVGGRL